MESGLIYALGQFGAVGAIAVFFMYRDKKNAENMQIRDAQQAAQLDATHKWIRDRLVSLVEANTATMASLLAALRTRPCLSEALLVKIESLEEGMTRVEARHE